MLWWIVGDRVLFELHSHAKQTQRTSAVLLGAWQYTSEMISAMRAAAGVGDAAVWDRPNQRPLPDLYPKGTPGVACRYGHLMVEARAGTHKKPHCMVCGEKVVANGIYYDCPCCTACDVCSAPWRRS